MIPFKILAAVIATFIYIISKLSSELNISHEFNDTPYWKIAAATASGVAAYFWVSSLFGMASNSPIGVFLGISACIVCIAYNINKIDFSDHVENADKMSERADFIGKEGKIIDIISKNPQSDGDIACVGELFEGKEKMIVIHVCGDANIGDKFHIAQIGNDKIYAVID